MTASDRIEQLLASGELARVAKECASQNELCRRIGMSKDAFISARIRLIARGVAVPGFEELKAAPEGDFLDEIAEERGFDLDRLEPGRWPSLSQFDAAMFRDEEAVQHAQQPYVPPVTPMSRKLTRAECPDGSWILWASDIHIPIHNVVSCDLMVECAERNGVKRTIAGGDILDFNCLSRHKKQARRMVEHATLLEEVEPGRNLLNWFGSKDTDYILGNHEGRLQSFIDENPVFHGSLLSNFASVVDLPRSINVVPQGGEVRLGNLSARHTDAEFKGGSGGKYPAQRLLDLFPDQSTIGGHVHRISCARRTTADEDGIKRTRCAWTMGHMSLEHEHYEYMSTSPNWQTGFAMIRVYWEGDRPRWTVYQIEVLFDRWNRPYFEFGGHVYSAAKRVAA